MRRTLTFVLMVMIFSFACQKKQQSQMAKKAEIPILTNQLDENELLAKVPAMKDEMENYQPDSAAIAYLKNFDKDLTITVLLGTWCPDSRREVPRFMKVIKEANNPHFKCEFFGLDRSKSDSLGMGKKYQVEYVPTFVVQMNGAEIGRIIETPTETIEQDLVQILENAGN